MYEIGVMSRIRLRSRVLTMVKGTDLYLRFNDNLHKIKNYDADLNQTLAVWRNGGTRDDFFNTLDEYKLGLGNTYQEDLESLVEKGFFENLDIESSLDPTDLEIWKRSFDYFSAIETENMSRFDYIEKIRNLKIMIVGLGGLGSWVFYKLLCLGVGNFVLVDGDKVELSNLNRAILYKTSDVGSFKADCAKRVAKEFSPNTKVEIHKKFVGSSDDLLPHLDNVDLVVNCADEPAFLINQWVTDACVKKEIPLITGTGGRVGPFFIPGKTACRVCILSSQIDKNPEFINSIKRQQELPPSHPGVVATNLGMIASLLSNEIFNYFTKLSSVNTFNQLIFVNKTLNQEFIKVNKNQKCISCGENANSIKGGESNE
ncbi:HesA/MoeB/ThiF family protein [Cytobacillus sp. Hm23]